MGSRLFAWRDTPLDGILTWPPRRGGGARGVPGINVNEADDSGKTTVFIASENGHAKVVNALLRVFEIDVNRANVLGNTPLCFAAQVGRTRWLSSCWRRAR